MYTTTRTLFVRCCYTVKMRLRGRRPGSPPAAGAEELAEQGRLTRSPQPSPQDDETAFIENNAALARIRLARSQKDRRLYISQYE